MKERKQKSLGVPRYITSGSHENSGTKYRFMVMERFETDLQKLFEQNQKRFQEKTVYQLAIKLVIYTSYQATTDASNVC